MEGWTNLKGALLWKFRVEIADLPTYLSLPIYARETQTVRLVLPSTEWDHAMGSEDESLKELPCAVELVQKDG